VDRRDKERKLKLLREKKRREDMKRWATDPWEFIKECCWTIDEADGGKIKQFPDKEYLHHVCIVWMRENLLAIPKSRRMLLTWILLALHLWAALFRPRSAIFIQSKKEGDSAYLIGPERLLFMYRRLPDGYAWPKIKSIKGAPPLIRFSNGSQIFGIGQGPDQMRQYTASYVMLDEVAFWEWGRQTWGALKPTMQGGGKITAVSSANAGFFQELVTGKL
jgi:hypothetical protein